VRCSRFTIRPSGKLRRFMAMLIIRSRVNAQRKRIPLRVDPTLCCSRSDVASAPLQLLPNHIEE
jgi:hypothetical protein